MNYIDSNLKVVGTRPLRPDGVDKVTGRAMYSADTRMAGMMWGKILRSPHAHAPRFRCAGIAVGSDPVAGELRGKGLPRKPFCVVPLRCPEKQQGRCQH